MRFHQQPAPTISPGTFFGLATHLCRKAGLILLQDSTGISKTTFLRLSISLFVLF